MENPQLTVLRLLQTNAEKSFSLIVNGTAVQYKGRRVYVRFDDHELYAYTRKRNIVSQVTEDKVYDLSHIWQELKNAQSYAGIDFSSEFGDDKVFKVYVNDSFKYLFIESPFISIMKSVINFLNVPGQSRTINSISFPEMDVKLASDIKKNWFNLYSYFQLDSILKYINLHEDLLGNAIRRRLYYQGNMFNTKIYGEGGVNFLHPFIDIQGVYNPFLEDYNLTALGRDSQLLWFDSKNSHLFCRSTESYKVYCITPVSFCRCLGLSHKLNFDDASALYLLAGLLYSGSVRSPLLPSNDTEGYLRVVYSSQDESSVQSVDMVLEKPEVKDGLTSLSKMTTLEYYLLMNWKKLTEGSDITRQKLLEILKPAYLVRKGDVV